MLALMILQLVGCDLELCDSSCWLPNPAVCLDPGESDTHDLILDCSASNSDCDFDIWVALRGMSGTNTSRISVTPDTHPVNAGQKETLTVTLDAVNDVEGVVLAEVKSNCATCNVETHFWVDARNTDISKPCP